MDVRRFLERALPDYAVGEALREDAEGAWWRGRRIADEQAILFVTSVADHPSAEWTSRLEREHDLRSDLELPWAARPLALVRHEGKMVLVLQDPGGVPLDSSAGRRFTVAESLRIGLGIAASLARAHAKGIVHRDIKPANILANLTTGAVALTGFGPICATRARGFYVGEH